MLARCDHPACAAFLSLLLIALMACNSIQALELHHAPEIPVVMSVTSAARKDRSASSAKDVNAEVSAGAPQQREGHATCCTEHQCALSQGHLWLFEDGCQTDEPTRILTWECLYRRAHAAVMQSIRTRLERRGGLHDGSRRLSILLL